MQYAVYVFPSASLRSTLFGMRSVNVISAGATGGDVADRRPSRE